MTDGGRPAGDAPDFDPWAAGVGVALLRLQARASDPRKQPSWVNRRVEQLEFIDTRAVRWHVSVDFNVPERAPRVPIGNEEFRLVPITSLAKRNLVAFSLRDEQSTAMWLPTSRETVHFLASALVHGASRVLGIAPHDVPPALVKELERIVSTDPGELASKPPALLAAAALIDADRNWDYAMSEYNKALTRRAQRALDAASQVQRQAARKWRVTNKEIRIVALRLMANTNFRNQVEELAQNFVVHVATKTAPGSRRIIKLTYESYAPRRVGTEGWPRKFWQSLGWRLWQFDLLIGGRGGSYHLEVAAPPGVDVVGITADRHLAREPDPKIRRWRRLAAQAWWRRVVLWEPRADAAVQGYMPHVHINPPDGAFIRYRAAIFIRVSRPGWLTASWLIALAIALVLVVGRFNLQAVYAKDTVMQAGTAATLLLALLGVFATLLVRPGEHPLASRLLRVGRLLILLDAAVVLVGVGNLVLHRAQHPIPVTIWTWLAIVSGAVFVLFTISWLLPVAHQPHRE